uniref:NADH dehydrogenase subunit 4L n=1 Tax=Hydroptila angulata TaxID=1875522 RepID=UPI0022DCDC7D|nr:NADH dehydrogenase subunit 4L [Hydroptila angulata]UZZ44048.1 NADH dehydrogenase subunit 4L [Hydroptila angulata]
MTIFFLFYMLIFMFFIGNLVFSFCRDHLLLLLMIIEFMVLVLFIFMVNYLMMMMSEFFLLMVFLVFSVCEGILGISLLVYMVRVYGNDYFSSFNLLC